VGRGEAQPKGKQRGQNRETTRKGKGRAGVDSEEGARVTVSGRREGIERRERCGQLENEGDENFSSGGAVGRGEVKLN